MTNSNISKLQEDTFLLDEAFGVMKDEVITINAVAQEFMQLTQKMDETDINQVRRKCVILSQLLYRAIENLDGESTAAHKIHLKMFDLINELETEKKPSLPAKENEGTI